MGCTFLGIASKVNVPLVVLIGPSGSGKSSVAHLLSEVYGFQLIKTVTTRPQRDEFDTDHTFISEETYQNMKDSGGFFGVLEVFGAYYGLPVFNPAQKSVLLLRAPAIEQFLTKFPEATIIEIDAPLDVLVERLTTRGSHDRIDKAFLVKEIEQGRSVATQSIDSSTRTSEEIAQAINKLIV